MVELRNEDQKAFQNSKRMPPAMFDEIVQRLTPALTKETTNWRAPLNPGLKVSLTLRHLASGAKYREMQYGWMVYHNTVSLVLREVCAAIVEEFRDELLAPPQTAAEWRQISDNWMNSSNFPHVIGAIDDKHIACKSPANIRSDYLNYKGFFSVILLAVVTSDYKFLWIDVSGKGLRLMPTSTMQVISERVSKLMTSSSSTRLAALGLTAGLASTSPRSLGTSLRQQSGRQLAPPL
jgi:hypothetical protein